MRLLLGVANLVIRAESLEVVPPLDKVQACHELLRKLSRESAVLFFLILLPSQGGQAAGK